MCATLVACDNRRTGDVETDSESDDGDNNEGIIKKEEESDDNDKIQGTNIPPGLVGDYRGPGSGFDPTKYMTENPIIMDSMQVDAEGHPISDVQQGNPKDNPSKKLYKYI